MLKEQNPLIGGLQAPVLSEQIQMVPPDSEFVQILHEINN